MNPARFQKFFPQYDDLPRKSRGLLLSAIILNGIFLAIVLTVVVYALTPGASLDVQVILFALLFEILVWITWHKKGLNWATNMLVAGAWAIIAAVVLFSGGISSTATVAQLLVLIMAALLSSARATIGIVGLTAGFNAFLVYLEMAHGLPENGLTEINEVRLALHITIMLLAAATLLHSSRTSRYLVDNLANNERKFRALFEKTSDAVFLIGLDYHVLEANVHASIILGYEPAEWIGLKFEELLPADERANFQNKFDMALSQDVVAYTNNRFLTKSAWPIIMEVNLALVRDQGGKPLHYQSIGRDVTEKVDQDRKLEQTLAHMAVKAKTDFLTGVLNRESILQQAQMEWARFQTDGQPMSIMLVDMDRLKAINDEHGHLIGDLALKQLVEILENQKRLEDWLGRYGGDEFMIVLPGAPSEVSDELSERVIAAIEAARIRTANGDVSFGCSIGVASTNHAGYSDLTDLIARADLALYANKIGPGKGAPVGA